jgi:ubiquinone/menaquinone biosynthesis C-methylase UbiE
MKPWVVLLAAALGASAQVAQPDPPNRARTQSPEGIVDTLRLQPGMTVADIGTGSGFMLPYLSKAVGRTGVVFAEDSQPELLERARQKIAAEKLTNVTLIQGTDYDPKLPEGKFIDAILLLGVYHHLDSYQALRAMTRWLRFGGPLVIVEDYKAESPAGQTQERDEVAHDVGRQLGIFYEMTSHIDQLNGKQYALIFERVLGVH